MSEGTPIQWTDDTVNPIMGCNAPCELRPSPTDARKLIRSFFRQEFPEAAPSAIEQIDQTVDSATAGGDATDIYQLRGEIVRQVLAALGPDQPSKVKLRATVKRLKAKLDSIYICYAHQLHMFRGLDAANPDKRTNAGFAPKFEVVTKYPGRMAKAACSSDLFGEVHPNKPWLNYLPRSFFVSDMADALSGKTDFAYLEQEIIDVVGSNQGRRHLWFWLTKMPKRMAELAQYLKKKRKTWPDNLVAMTSVTSKETIWRAEELKAVPARFRGLSVEPLWEGVELSLKGISWCIVGGQSGHEPKPFDLAWITSLQAQCKASGTALFVKQLGSKPVWKGEDLTLNDKHGGDWSQWPAEMRVRDMPAGFRSLRFETVKQ